MRSRPEFEKVLGETLLLIPFLAVLIGLLVYLFVEMLPKVKVLLG